MKNSVCGLSISYRIAHYSEAWDVKPGFDFEDETAMDWQSTEGYERQLAAEQREAAREQRAESARVQGGSTSRRERRLTQGVLGAKACGIWNADTIKDFDSRRSTQADSGVRARGTADVEDTQCEPRRDNPVSLVELVVLVVLLMRVVLHLMFMIEQ